MPPGSQVCSCGRSFMQLSAFSKHQRTCQKAKNRLSGALGKAKEIWASNKRRRLEISGNGQLSTPHRSSSPDLEANSEHAQAEDDSNLSLLERMPWARRLGRQLPQRFRDVLPEAPPPLIPIAQQPVPSDPQILPPNGEPRRPAGASLSSHIASVGRHIRGIFTTQRNNFGLLRKYHADEPPAHDPEDRISLTDLSNISSEPCTSDITALTPFYPYPNYASFLLGDWYWNGGAQKSQTSFKDLIKIIGNPDFRPEDVCSTKWDQVNNRLGGEHEEDWTDEEAYWECTPITIKIPYQTRRGQPTDPEAGPQDYTVANFHHRSLVSIIKEKLSNSAHDQLFHYEPYELLWQPRDVPDPIRVYGELYTSQAFIDAHRILQDSPAEPGCDLQRVIVGMMFWSDATHLTSFGDTKLHPLYMCFGNESKYRRGKPACHLCNHVAYFEKLPDDFKDFSMGQTAGRKTPRAEFMAHCHRELMHEQWKIILNEEFIKAWEHGIVIMCCDGIERRFFPRIFTYSADYPEKILLAGIRNLGGCPCPRCLIPKIRIHNVGMARDMRQRVTMARMDDIQRRTRVTASRRLIYENGRAVNCVPVEDILKATSLVPNTNAFSDRLAPLGFNLFSMLVVDLLHEFELGVWRAVFIHLLRIIESVDEILIAELNRRYREIPSFGRDTIRRFPGNCSEMKRMAAHDFEDLLQCAIPVFDGLFPEPYNGHVRQLLFTLAYWHALAKLRMHNDLTVKLLEAATTSLGDRLRMFSKRTCSAFDTRELRREMDVRIRRQARDSIAMCPPARGDTSSQTVTRQNRSVLPAASSIRSTTADKPTENSAQPSSNSRRPKTLNLNTYKTHALGDYAAAIIQYGTTDSYSTAPGELEHRTPKGRYARTSRKNFTKQLTQMERRQARILRIHARHQKDRKFANEEFDSTIDVHHVIGKSQNHPENIPLFLQKHDGDPAVKDFVPKLKDHLLPRIRAILMEEAASIGNEPSILPNVGLSSPTGTFDQQERESVLFKNDNMYRHQLFKVNYTTYDVRRSQDVINSNTSHRDIMFLATNAAELDREAYPNHRFLYARVLGIFHVNVIYVGQGMLDYRPRRLDFLWVRRFVYVGKSVDWEDCTLDRVYFSPMADEHSFGFVDPANVLRGSHIIPAFNSGKVHSDGVGLSRCAGDAQDWRGYVINRFVDRDMAMRYHWGFAVGHVYTHGQTAALVAPPTVMPPSPSGSNYEESDEEIEAIDPDIPRSCESDCEDLEFSFEDRQDDTLDDSPEDFDELDYSDDSNEFIAMADTYGF